MAIIETQNLTKRYGKLVALENLNLKIDEKHVYGFIGPNGAGKTTTFRILATLLRPSSGRAFINGLDVMKSPYEIKKSVGYMPDSFGVYDGMRLVEYLDFFGAAYKIPAAKRKAIIADVLELTDLTGKADEYVSAFSRGMKQRCCLAKTLIHDPKVLLLDEPASGLDPRARIEIREIIKTLRDMGKTIFISSHILTELSDMCDQVAIIENGKLIAAGDLHDIVNGGGQIRVIKLEVIDGAEAAENILNITSGLTNIKRSGNKFQLESNLDNQQNSRLLSDLVSAGVKVLYFRQEEESLEDLFMKVTKGKI